MAASDRRDLELDLELEKVANNIDALAFDIKHLILTFFGKIGTKDFQYRRLPFKDKNTGETKFPTFYGNLMVLCSYMDRAKLTEMIALNLLWHIQIEETLVSARQNPKSLPIPVKIQDPYGQWIEATPLQTVYAAGDRNPPNMNPEAKPFGLVERLGSCFENSAHAAKQIAEWKKDSQKATEETMKPYVVAMTNTCQQIIECNEISDNVRWEDVLTLAIFLRLDEDFREALIPNPNHVVRSGFLFSMEIFLHLFETFKANVDNDNVEDKSRPNLGGWWSRKSDALDTIVYPKLQARSSRCDLGIFNKGIGNVSEGKIPERLDFTNGLPEILTGIGSALFFGFFGDKLPSALRGVGESAAGGPAGPAGMGMACSARFRNLYQAKTAVIEIKQPQPSHPPRRCVMM